MLKKMFSVRDQKGGFYHPPRLLHTHAEAEREFSTLCNDTETMLGRYPQDYDLYYLGEFDTLTGKMSTMDTPQHLHNGVAFKQHRNPTAVEGAQPSVQ